MDPEQSPGGAPLSTRVAIPHIAITVAGRNERSYTSFGAAGDGVLGLETVLPSCRFELVSCYVREVGVSHLLLAPESQDDGRYRVVPSDRATTITSSWCLLEHLGHLRERLAAERGADVRIDVADAALDRAAAWSRC